ncbi:tetratricopeptide repeat protein [Dongia soli]|uniref:Tetratricopeptide repeat protein n=1 Tax=Dongia soli TaxID=600628 RepID=A0ABU5E6L8_9PROT|nr:tetratricopeptide repeat protein [Dongia soli]MDY0881925.1 tetratricopeptide repeat protein [Dongia soli]
MITLSAYMTVLPATSHRIAVHGRARKAFTYRHSCLFAFFLWLVTAPFLAHPAAAVALGGDDRVAVPRLKDSTFAPVGLLVLDENKSDAVAGTAFLVSPCHILTAYHVAGGGQAINNKTVATFYLGEGKIGPDFDGARHFADETPARPVAWGNYVPAEDSSPLIQRARAMLQNGWEDWALLKLDRCLGAPQYGYGYFRLAPRSTRDLTRRGEGLRVTSIGLPGDKPMRTLWRDPSCRIVGQTHNSGWQHDCVTVPGNSGGPLLLAPSAAKHGASLDRPGQDRPPVVALAIAITGVDGLDNSQSDRLALAWNDPNYYDFLGTAAPVSALIARVAPYLPRDAAIDAFIKAHPADDHYNPDQGQAAIADLDIAIARYPHRAELYLQRASWRDSLGNSDAALGDYAKAVAVDPSSAPARYLYGRALLQRGNDQPGNLALAAEAFGKVLQDFPHSPDVLLYRAFAYRAMKRNQAAVADLTAALVVQPKSAVAADERGDAYRDLRQPDLALADYNRAISLDPQWPEALRDRGFLYHRLARYDQARADFKRALALDPHDVEAENGLALCNLSSGRIDAAIANFGHIISMAPEVGVYYANRGTAYLIAGEAAEAVPDFEKAAALDSDEPFNALLLYIALARTGQSAKAKAVLETYAAKRAQSKKANAAFGDANDRSRRSWPQPVIDFFLGKINLDQVAAAAAKGDPMSQADQRFDVDFYLGQLALLRGDKAEGSRRLQAVIRSGLREFVEFDIAQADLDLLEH